MCMLFVIIEGEFGKQEDYSELGSAMLFDSTKCIRCGLCAEKCPTDACMMTTNTFNDTFVESTTKVKELVTTQA